MSKSNFLRRLNDVISGVHIDLLKYESRHGLVDQCINEHLIAAQELLVTAIDKALAAERQFDWELKNAHCKE